MKSPCPIRAAGWISMPVTARVSGTYLSIAEAALRDYGDLALKRGPDGATAAVATG